MAHLCDQPDHASLGAVSQRNHSAQSSPSPWVLLRRPLIRLFRTIICCAADPEALLPILWKSAAAQADHRSSRTVARNQCFAGVVRVLSAHSHFCTLAGHRSRCLPSVVGSAPGLSSSLQSAAVLVMASPGRRCHSL